MSDLIVISFDSVATAEEVRGKVRGLQKQGLIALTDAAVISKDADGKIQVHNEVSRETKVGAGVGLVMGALLTVVFPAALLIGAAGGAAIGATQHRRPADDARVQRHRHAQRADRRA